MAKTKKVEKLRQFETRAIDEKRIKALWDYLEQTTFSATMRMALKAACEHFNLQVKV